MHDGKDQIFPMQCCFEALGYLPMNNISRKVIFKMLNSPGSLTQVGAKALWKLLHKLQSKSGPVPRFLNKVLLEHSHSRQFG